MIKLFALEDNEDTNNNDLLIDKVLNYNKLDKQPLSLTADIIKERQDLKEEIDKKLNSEDNKSSESNENSDDSNSEKDSLTDIVNDDNSDNNDNSNEKENKDDSNEKSDKNNENNEKKDDSENNDEEDLSAAADKKDSLNSIIGSGLNSSNNEKNEDKSNTKKEVAEESFNKPKKILTKNIFTPLKDHYSKYLMSLESYNIPFKLALEEQPIVYVKESVLESLNNLIIISNKYIENNKLFIENTSKSIKDINEKITILKQFIENRQYNFTNKLINDKDLISLVSVPDKSNLRDTIKILLNYITNSNKANNLILNNDFNSMLDAYSKSDFIKEEHDYIYKEILPGFNLIKLNIDDYTNYLKTNIENFHYYKLKVLKTEDLYNLNSIEITEDKEIDYLISNIDKLLIECSMYIDNLNAVNETFTKFIESIKVIIYDVNQDKYNNLADIDIDNKVKDFIRFKMLIESYFINVKLILDYLSGCESVINICVELKS